MDGGECWFMENIHQSQHVVGPVCRLACLFIFCNFSVVMFLGVCVCFFNFLSELYLNIYLRFVFVCENIPNKHKPI